MSWRGRSEQRAGVTRLLQAATTQLLQIRREKYIDPGALLWQRLDNGIGLEQQLDDAFDLCGENDYQKGELIGMLREALGEDLALFRDEVLWPRYRVSKSQLDRCVDHYYRASSCFSGNPRLRTLLFRRWRIDGAFDQRGNFKPEIEQAIQLCGGVPRVGRTEPEYLEWTYRFINTVQHLLNGIPTWPRGKSYGERVVEQTLRNLSEDYPLLAEYRHNCSTWFSGRLRYDFAIPTRSSQTYHLIEIQGKQHYSWDYDDTNDKEKKRLAHFFDCPLLEIGYWEFRGERDVHYDAYHNMRYIVEPFVASIEQRGRPIPSLSS